MTCRFAIALLLVSLGLPLGHARAQEKPAAPAAAQTARAVDPVAKEFIEAFRSAARAVKDISCTVTQTMVDGEETQSQSGEFIAVIARPTSPAGRASLKQFRISARHGAVDSVWAFDGKAATRLDNAAKTFTSMESAEGPAFPVADASMVVPTWVYGTDVLSSRDARLVEARMLPDAQADGVACRVVEYAVDIVTPPPADAGEGVEPLKMTMRQTRHVGADDLIPRRIESRTSFSGGIADDRPAMRTFTAAYTKVRVNAGASPESFVLAAPAGFKTVQADAQDLGVPSNERPKLKFSVGDAAPAFSMKNPEGVDVTLQSLKGRVVLLDFWATWCGPCKMAMPGVQKLHEQFAGKPVTVFGVNTWERGTVEQRKAKSTKYMADQKYSYPQLLGGDDLAKAYGITGIPTFILIGPDGKIIHIGVGFDEGQEEQMASLIEKAIAGK